MFKLLYLFNKAVDIYIWIILIRVLISWVAPYSRNEFVHLIHRLTDPLMERCRVLIPMGRSYMDLSPVIAYFIVILLKRVVNYLFYFLLF